MNPGQNGPGQNGPHFDNFGMNSNLYACSTYNTVGVQI